jgi:hypothetical protein
MHAFWRETDEGQRLNQMINLMKNVSMLGGALVLFYVWNQLQDEAGSRSPTRSLAAGSDLDTRRADLGTLRAPPARSRALAS